jgi:urease gamma subunit
MRLAFLTVAALMSTMVTTEAMDGKMVYEFCKSSKGRIAATMYVSGVVDVLLEDTGRRVEACIPGSISRNTLTDVACDWMTTNTDKLERPAALAVITSLESEFPCPGVKAPDRF